MVKNEKLSPGDSVSFVELFFLEQLKCYILKKKGDYTGYWWIEYEDEKKNVVIYFDGDIGGHFTIYICRTKYSLWQYNRSVNNYTESTSKNILYQLSILKQFLNEVEY